MQRIAPLWVLVSILLIPLGGLADADGRDEARLHFEAGKVLFTNEDFDSAAMEFAASTTLYPTQNGYYNLANCYLALHQYGAALDTLATLKVRFPDAMSNAMKRKVRKTEVTIRKITGEISLEVVPVESSITLNGKKMSRVGHENPIVLAPGNYTIDVEHPGHQRRKLSVTVLSQKRRHIQVELEPIPPPPVQPLPPASASRVAVDREIEATSSTTGLRPYMWVATFSAATTAVAAIVFYGLAASQNNEAQSLASDWQETYPGSSREAALESEFENAADSSRTFRNVAYGLTIGSAIFSVGAVILRYGRWDRKTERIEKVDVSLRPGGVEVSF